MLKILIADDNELNREILSEMLADKYEIHCVENGVEALRELSARRDEYALLLLDIVMPEMDGFQVLARMNENNWLYDLPVIIISSEAGTEFMRRAFDFGASDYISRPFDAYVVKHRVDNSVNLYSRQRRLTDAVYTQAVEKEKESRLMVNILSHIVEFRNGESGMHVLHVQEITKCVLRALERITDRYSLSQEQINVIGIASALHDVGKISIPSEILNKPGRFTPEEFAVMKTHCEIGANMLQSLAGKQDSPILTYAIDICRCHHERAGGKGYPAGLTAEQIPIWAQAVALADVYDALTSVRCYKNAYSYEKAVEMILAGECGEFSDEMQKCLRLCAGEIKALMESHGFNDFTDDGMVLLDRTIAGDTGAVAEMNRKYSVLRRQSDALAEMFDNATFEYTSSLDFMRFSPKAAEILGLRHDKIVDPASYAPLTDMFEPGAWDELLKIMHKAGTDGRFECRLKAVLPSGEKRLRIFGRTFGINGDETPTTAAGGIEVEE